MKYFLSAIFILIGLISCNSNQIAKKAAPTDMYRTQSDDKEMNTAIATAKNTLEQFDKALKSKKFDTSTFALKVKFLTSTGAEHIWVNNIMIIDGNYFGTLDNVPEDITGLKIGDKIKLVKASITDWMYADKEILRGGYTIKVIRSRMTKEEQTKLDSSFPYKIDALK